MIQPEAHHIEHRLLQSGVAPVNIRLLGKKHMVVPLPRRCVPCPGVTAKDGGPMSRRLLRTAAIFPDVPVALRICSGGTGLLEPRVLVGCMVHNEIHEYTYVPLLGFRGETVPIVHGSVLASNIGVIRDIVSEIFVRRWKEGSDPD